MRLSADHPTLLRRERRASGRGFEGKFVLDEYLRLSGRRRYGQTSLPQHVDVFLHAGPGLVDAVLDRMSDAGKSLHIGRIEPKKCRVAGRFNHQGIRKIDHGGCPFVSFRPAAFKIAWQVPVGTSFEP